MDGSVPATPPARAATPRILKLGTRHRGQRPDGHIELALSPPHHPWADPTPPGFWDDTVTTTAVLKCRENPREPGIERRRHDRSTAARLVVRRVRLLHSACREPGRGHRRRRLLRRLGQVLGRSVADHLAGRTDKGARRGRVVTPTSRSSDRDALARRDRRGPGDGYRRLRRSLSTLVGPSVVVTAVSPWWPTTPLTPASRPGPARIATRSNGAVGVPGHLGVVGRIA